MDEKTKKQLNIIEKEIMELETKKLQIIHSYYYDKTKGDGK